MVKLTGPGLAQKASGSIGGAVTFSDWKGKPYLKLHRKPKQPRSTGQVGMRSTLTFLSQQWSGLGDAKQASWDAIAETGNISPFNAYLQENLRRWRNYLMPSKAYPATAAGTFAASGGYGVAGYIRSVWFFFQIITPNDVWGMRIHEVTAPMAPPTWNNLIHVEECSNAQWYLFLLPGFAAGTHYFAIDEFTDDGNTDHTIANVNTVVID